MPSWIVPVFYSRCKTIPVPAFARAASRSTFGVFDDGLPVARQAAIQIIGDDEEDVGFAACSGAVLLAETWQNCEQEQQANQGRECS